MVMRCGACGMICIPQIEDDHAIIADGPVLKDKPISVLTSSQVSDVAGSWELELLKQKKAEQPALHINARDALRRIERFVPPGRLLDVGCGWGFFLGAAKERGWQPFGLEPLPAHAVYARATFGAQILTDVVRETSYPRDYFDAITAFQVFEHLPEPSDVLQKLARFLRPGGVLAIEVPNIDTWTVRLLGRHHRHYVQDHLNFFSRQTLAKLLQEHGFEVAHAYSPTRRMTLHHLVANWGGKVLPRPLGPWIRALPSNNLRGIVPLNIGDIIAVIGRKR